jgi:hypothetical protein
MHEEHPWISMGDNCALLESFTVMSEPNLYTHSGISESLTFGQPELWMPESWTSIRKNGYCIYGYKYLIVIHNGPL